jgi:tetratricopeptide (TPR) repeat protein
LGELELELSDGPSAAPEVTARLHGLDVALTHLTHALDLKESVLPHNDVGLVACLRALGQVWMARGYPERAHSLLARATEILQLQAPDALVEKGRVLHASATALEALGRYQAALSEAQAAASMKQGLWPRAHPVMVDTAQLLDRLKARAWWKNLNNWVGAVAFAVALGSIVAVMVENAEEDMVGNAENAHLTPRLRVIKSLLETLYGESAASHKKKSPLVPLHDAANRPQLVSKADWQQ